MAGTALRETAKTCVADWIANRTQSSELVPVLKATIVEGNRKDGLSRNFMNHVLGLISNMKCWDSEQAEQDWKYSVCYDVQPEHLERGSASLRSDPMITDLSTSTLCDIKGNDSELCIKYKDVSLTPVYFDIGKYAKVNIHVERNLNRKHYIKTTSAFKTVVVEARKTFTFKAHYDGSYHFGGCKC